MFCNPDTGGKCDGKYRRHKPQDCEGRAFKGKFNNKRKGAEEKDSTTQNTEERLKVAEALETVVNNESDGSLSDGYES